MPRAVITGVRGQDGTYLAEYLIRRGYEVVGTSSTYTGVYRTPLQKLDVHVVKLDVSSATEVQKFVEGYRPDEIYHLGARSSSGDFNADPEAMVRINGLSSCYFLDAIRIYHPTCRFCQAASSEMYAGVTESPQDEETSCKPLNYYGASKILAKNFVEMYRTVYGLFASAAILYNHESPLRSNHFVSRKISEGVALIVHGRTSKLVLGTLDSRRDWGFAGDYVRAMHLMVQAPKASDYVIATGRTHSVRELCSIAFEHVGLDYRNYVQVLTDASRRTERVELCGDATKARVELGWEPVVSFPELIRSMVDHDVNSLLAEAN